MKIKVPIFEQGQTKFKNCFFMKKNIRKSEAFRRIIFRRKDYFLEESQKIWLRSKLCNLEWTIFTCPDCLCLLDLIL